MNVQLSFLLNGEQVKLETSPLENLLEVLRDHLNITSVKYGCEEGNCGACTVLLDGQPVNSCLILAPTVNGRSVQTIDGLGTIDNPHPLQKAFYELYASQCGFCTPGMIMAAKGLLDHNLAPTREQIVEALAGNVCRCTGYEKIIAAVGEAARLLREGKDTSHE